MQKFWTHIFNTTQGPVEVRETNPGCGYVAANTTQRAYGRTIAEAISRLLLRREEDQSQQG